MTPPKVSSANGQARVLIAEDDALLAETVHDFLVQEGFVAAIAADGQAALQIAADMPFDVLLTDLRMPVMDGVELIRRLRSERPTLPVVVMSGNAPADLNETLRHYGSGPLVILRKPMRVGQLLQALQQTLGNPPAPPTPPPASMPPGQGPQAAAG